jgi:hypothetical protein
VWKALKEELDLPKLDNVAERHAQSLLKRSRDTTNEEVLRAVMLAVEQMDGPTENLEFVAKTLLHSEHMHVTLGTPLYVASANSGDD